MGLLGNLFDGATDFISDACKETAEIITRLPEVPVEIVKKTIEGAADGIDKASKKIFDE